MNLVEMENVGVADYYLELSKFIHDFVNRNYPLTIDDMKEIVNDVETENIKYRNEILNVMNAALEIILMRKTNENLEFIKNTNNGIYLRPVDIKTQQEEIYNYSQQILETLWIYKQSKEDNVGRKNNK